MKIIRPNVPATNDLRGGYVGEPQSREWLKDWIEEKGRWVELECKCIEDIGDRSLTIINKFKGCTVYCERCNRFVSVVQTLRTKRPPMPIPKEPLF